MTPEEHLRRADHAKRILEDPLYQESWQAIRERIVEQLESADLADAMRERLNYLLVANARAHHYLQSVMEAGKVAAQEIERKQTMAERAQNALRRFR